MAIVIIYVVTQNRYAYAAFVLKKYHELDEKGFIFFWYDINCNFVKYLK